MNHKRTVLLGSVCVAFLAAAYSVAVAEEVASAAVNQMEATIQVPPLDEVIVTGQKEKLRQLQAEIYKAEDAYYEAFNQVNTERQYHTLCGIETATEKRQKVHACKPGFVSDAYDEARMMPGDPWSNLGSAAFVINSKMPLYKARMRELAQKNPQLRKSLGRYYALTQHYEAIRKEKYKGKWVVLDP